MSLNAKRATVRMVAERAGVSPSTVSLALRHSAKIALATRERVLHAAREVNYRPDPQVAKLMQHLSTRLKPRYKSTIAAITSRPESAEQNYDRDLQRGARERADALGYGFELFRFEWSDARHQSLQRVLLSRGVEGVLLPAPHEPVSLARLLDWSRFAVVATTTSVLAPEFSRVVPHHFGNTSVLCQHLRQLGYTRIGLAMKAGFESGVGRGQTAAAVWRHSLGCCAPVAPLLHAGDHPEPATLHAWFERESPDAIIVPGANDAKFVIEELGLALPGPVALVVNNLQGERSLFAGMEGRADAIGSAAVDLLHTRILTGEKGIPAIPSETLIRGQWVPGVSARPLGANAGSPDPAGESPAGREGASATRAC